MNDKIFLHIATHTHWKYSYNMLLYGICMVTSDTQTSPYLNLFGKAIVIYMTSFTYVENFIQI